MCAHGLALRGGPSPSLLSSEPGLLRRSGLPGFIFLFRLNNVIFFFLRCTTW